MFCDTLFYPLGSVIITKRFEPYISLLPGSFNANILAVLEGEAFLLHALPEIIKAVGNSYQFINAFPDLLFPRRTTFQIYPFMIAADYRLADIILPIERLDTVPLANLVRQPLYLFERCLVGIKVPALEVVDIDLNMIVNLSRIIVSCNYRLHIFTEHLTHQIQTYLLCSLNADVVLRVERLDIVNQFDFRIPFFRHRLVKLPP